MDWRILALVGGGGALGSMSRHLLASSLDKPQWPYGVFAVNVLGCFAIGFLLFSGPAGGWMSPEGRAFLSTGILGGFTTMSAFTRGTIDLIEAGALGRAAGYAAATVVLCLLATALGRVAALATWHPH